jgi:tRNA pseudouridine55 synthase
MILNLYKKPGETPLERVERFRLEKLEYADISMSYAGRLDPLAAGVLLVLVGDEANRPLSRIEHLNLDKIYTVDVLFGLQTDTYDLLGLVNFSNNFSTMGMLFDESYLKSELKKHEGKSLQPYPTFSSKHVQGKPLFEWAKSGKLSEIHIPVRKIEIYKIDLIHLSEISAAKLLEKALAAATSVLGDFRQREISECWSQALAAIPGTTFTLASLRISCSSGTYIRSLANSLGKSMHTGGIAMNIIREQVGEFKLTDSII